MDGKTDIFKENSSPHMKKIAPNGLRIVCFVYLINAVLYLVSLLLFYNRILVWGKEASFSFGWVVRLAYLAVPAYLFFGLKSVRKEAWFLAIGYHTYFIVNYLFELWEQSGFLHALIRISAPYSSSVYLVPQTIILLLFALVNLLMLLYLMQIKPYFTFR